MAIVTLPAPPPYGRIAVNTAQVFAAVADPQQPAAASELLFDAAGRQMIVLLPIDQAGMQLGQDFCRLDLAAETPAHCYVNRRLWVNIVPHPQVQGVCFVQGNSRHLAVRGNVTEIQQALT